MIDDRVTERADEERLQSESASASLMGTCTGMGMGSGMDIAGRPELQREVNDYRKEDRHHQWESV